MAKGYRGGFPGGGRVLRFFIVRGRRGHGEAERGENDRERAELADGGREFSAELFVEPAAERRHPGGVREVFELAAQFGRGFFHM